jgi:hypothetical protein
MWNNLYIVSFYTCSQLVETEDKAALSKYRRWMEAMKARKRQMNQVPEELFDGNKRRRVIQDDDSFPMFD